MAPVGGEVAGSWTVSLVSYSPEVALLCLLVLLLLSIFLTALCNDCGRQSFDLRDSELERNPSALIKVVKLEDAMVARENPMINEIRIDEKDGVQISNGTSGTTEKGRASPQADSAVDVNSIPSRELQASATPTAMSLPPAILDPAGLPSLEPEGLKGLRSAAQSREAGRQHIYDVIAEKGSGRVAPPTANQKPASAEEWATEELGPCSSAEGLSDRDWNPMYAQVSRKLKCPSPPPIPPPESEEEEESSPPLPDRSMELEG
ncbi:uncharacterized protein ACJ7VT_019595 [Polymixia lowei]